MTRKTKTWKDNPKKSKEASRIRPTKEPATHKEVYEDTVVIAKNGRVRHITKKKLVEIK